MGFDTLARQSQAHAPSSSGPHHDRLAALPLPHIDSFNNLFENANLLAEAIRDIGKRVIHDSLAENKLEGMH